MAEGGRFLEFSYDGAIATYREALLRPLDAAAAESVRLWETAAVNHCLLSRTFRDRDRAIAWLAG